MLQVISSFYTNCSKNSLFISANTYEKFVVSKEYCIARHDDKMCFLPNCRYHLILKGNIKDLQKLDAFCFNHQQVDCLYTLFKYRFLGKIVIRNGQAFDNLQRAVHFNQQTEKWRECPASRKRGSWGKSTKNICWAPSKRPNWRKLVDQCLQTELNKLRRLNLNSNW